MAAAAALPLRAPPSLGRKRFADAGYARDPSVTGVMMIESTHRLLSGERPAYDERAIVPDGPGTITLDGDRLPRRYRGKSYEKSLWKSTNSFGFSRLPHQNTCAMLG
jgi:hypothetical protein